jgi:hypothetical protein
MCRKRELPKNNFCEHHKTPEKKERRSTRLINDDTNKKIGNERLVREKPKNMPKLNLQRETTDGKIHFHIMIREKNKLKFHLSR